MGAWTLFISESQPFKEEPLKFWALLTVHDLEDRIAKKLEQHVDLMTRYPDLDNGRSQPSAEAARLRAFSRRLAEADPALPLVVAQGELPVSFGDKLFNGLFETVACETCGRVLRPEDTAVGPWEEDDGMQHYGEARRCPCGVILATASDGWRRP